MKNSILLRKLVHKLAEEVLSSDLKPRYSNTNSSDATVYLYPPDRNPINFESEYDSKSTQRSITLATYVKAKEFLNKNAPEGKLLDYGAGLGHGSEGGDSFEPYPQKGFTPTYLKPEDVPSNTYTKIVNLNVLNVVPEDVRDYIVSNIGKALKPGGMAIITTRGRDVLDAKGELGREPMSIITSKNTYQKGFTPSELVNYVSSVLGKDFEVEDFKLGKAGCLVTRKDISESNRDNGVGYQKLAANL
jgi:SAM-dependent methyltransferase